MSSSKCIAIDVMGGDFGPRLCVPAALNFLSHYPSYSIKLVGDHHQISSLVENCEHRDRIAIVATNQVVEMAEAPVEAYRSKRESSMWRSLELLAEDGVKACVSAGNTGALMAMSCHLIKTMEGMKRPAICKPIPTVKGSSYLLDMGANLDCSPEQLVQFALLGSAIARVNGVENPSVALINVGEETTKGNQDIKQTGRLLEQRSDINFKGFVEGNRLYDGLVDVVVCDGFVGNVALKVSEGAASFILNSLRQEYSTSLWRRLLGVLNYGVLKDWRGRFNPSKYNGAALLGLRKTVIKSHGSADVEGFYQAIVAAKQQVEAHVPEKLAMSLAAAQAD